MGEERPLSHGRGAAHVTGVTGRVFRAVIDGNWRGAEAAEQRRRLAPPELNGSWRGILGSSSILTVTEAESGWWRPSPFIQNDPGFLRHATGPDPAAGIAADGAFIVLERAETPDAGEEAARTGDDGIGADGRLRARDILGRWIPGDIAVLAACTTGHGKPTGDGVVGLSRAFLTAGPTTLVLTLSKVGLHSSLELMSGFHARLRGEAASRAEAMAEAQRQLITEAAEVENWSSFVLFGAP